MRKLLADWECYADRLQWYERKVRASWDWRGVRPLNWGEYRDVQYFVTGERCPASLKRKMGM